MSPQLVAARFIRYGPRAEWRDLVTGLGVTLLVEPLEEPMPRARLEREELLSGRPQPRLLDWGPLGPDRWFEAQVRAGEEWPHGPLVEVPDLIDALIQHVDVPARVGVRVARCPGATSVLTPPVVSLLARRLRARGFATIAPGAFDPSPAFDRLSRGHVAIVLTRDVDRDAVLTWLRRIVRTSLRAHVVIDARPDRPLLDGYVENVREQPPAYETPPARSSGGHRGRWLGRALGHARRGRPTAASRWGLAGAVGSRRTPVPEDTAATALVHALAASARSSQHADAVWQVTGEASAFDLHADLVAVTVRSFIQSCAFDLAAHALAAVHAEARLRRCLVPSAVEDARAELAFWRGSMGGALVDQVTAGARLAGRADAELRGLVQRHHGATAGPTSVGRLRQLESDMPVTTLHELAQVELEIGSEQMAGAGARLARLGRRRGLTPLASLVARWLRAVTGGSESERRAARAEVRRVGAAGVLRWGMRNREAQVLHALPELLQNVGDAEDEQSALVAACRWLRHQPGITGAAFSATATGRVLCTEGVLSLKSEDEGPEGRTVAAGRVTPQLMVVGPRALAWSGIQYCGTVIGRLSVEGDASAVESLPVLAAAAASACAPAVRARIDVLAVAAESHAQMPELLGRGPSIGGLRRAVARAAVTEFPVLIEGESGTGKELVARALHRLSARRDRRLCAVNCAALTDDLLEAELFGHARGAFTGAIGVREGLFEEADGGTLFLDEVGELSVRAQAKLLRVLQEREIRRLGENLPRKVNVRVVAATNRPIAAAAAAGQFREDLVFRLAVVRLRVPALRERLEDVPLLAQSFWRRSSSDARTRAALGPDALAALCRHTWPGNVRELQNIVAALALAAPGRGRVTERHVRQVIGQGMAADEAAGLSLDEARRIAERRAIAAALARHRSRRRAAAAELGVSRQGLAKAMRRLGLSSDAKADVA